MDNVKNDAYYVKRLKQDLEFVVTIKAQSVKSSKLVVKSI